MCLGCGGAWRWGLGWGGAGHDSGVWGHGGGGLRVQGIPEVWHRDGVAWRNPYRLMEAGEF